MHLMDGNQFNGDILKNVIYLLVFIKLIFDQGYFLGYVDCFGLVYFRIVF